MTEMKIEPRVLEVESFITDSKTREGVKDLIKRANAVSSELCGGSHIFRYAYHRIRNHGPYPILEIGSLRGASALALMAAIYATNNGRTLITVDPYHEIQFISNNTDLTPDYNGNVYRLQKLNLAQAAKDYAISHDHFHCKDMEYFNIIYPNIPNYNHFPAVQLPFSFIFLDAQHDAPSVNKQIEWAKAHIVPGGTILVDDAQEEPLYSGITAIHPEGKLIDIGGSRPYWVIEIP